MSALDTLRTLARGERPATGLLHNCRFEGGGVESYGIEAIVDRMRAAPFDLSPDLRLVESRRHVAVFDGDRAIVADRAGDNVARLWSIGVDRTADAEPSVAVPFDPDLAQGGGDVLFLADDHPDLAPGAASRVEAIGREIVAGDDGPRTRAFAIRAFGDADEGAVLYAVFRLHPARQALADFTTIAAHWGPGVHRVVRDRSGEATLGARHWTPRVGA